MNTKQKTAILAASLLLACTLGAQASGAPTSQFYFKGWPYRQSTGCTKPSCDDATACPTQAPGCQNNSCTTAPDCQPTACPTAIPTEAPIVTQEPTQAPVVSEEPVVTQPPVVTEQPTQAPAPTATKAPQPTPTRQPATVAPTKTPSSNDGDYTTGSISAQEQNAAQLLNADRAANGLGALTLDPQLCSLARMKSKDMSDNHYFAHTSPTYGSAADLLRANGYAFTSVGENIAHHATVLKAQAAFMSSDGHRRNILGSQWTKMGIGVWTDAQGFVYVTQLFVR